MSYLIVGLGNPGEKYQNTRHNAGWMVLEHLREESAFSEWRKEKRAKGSLADGRFGELPSDETTFLLPNTFMNRSGESVRTLVKNEKDAARMIVVHDEIDLPVGKMQISFGKGSGGHNGVQSIIDAIGTKNFTRIRLGISPVNWFGNMKKPAGKQNVTDFVLRDFTKREYNRFEAILPDVLQAIEMIIKEGKEKAMNEWNSL